MIIKCPKCGNKIAVNGLGRRKLAIPVENVYDAIQSCCTVVRAAEKLDCSRPYIYKVLKEHNLTPEILRKGMVVKC